MDLLKLMQTFLRWFSDKTHRGSWTCSLVPNCLSVVAPLAWEKKTTLTNVQVLRTNKPGLTAGHIVRLNEGKAFQILTGVMVIDSKDEICE